MAFSDLRNLLNSEIDSAAEDKEFISRLNECIAQYKAHFARYSEQERYKFAAVQTFQNNWDLEAEDLDGMLRRAFQPIDNNLWANYMWMPIEMLLKFAKFNPEGVRTLFQTVLNENLDLDARFTEMQNQALVLLEEYKLREKVTKTIGHFHDTRTFCLYLTMAYPDKYYYYMNSVFTGFADRIGFIANKRYNYGAVPEYFRLCDSVREVLLKDNELIKMHRERLLADDLYKDTELRMLTQDLIYCISTDKSIIQAEVEEIIPPGSDLWVLAPGEKASLWPQFQNEKMAAIGWGKLGNLLDYPDKDSFVEPLNRLYPGAKLDGSKKNDANAVFQFSREMKVGDLVIVRAGLRKIVGLGIVAGNYYQEPEEPEYSNRIPVDWVWTGEFDLPSGFNPFHVKTLTKFTPYLEYVKLANDCLLKLAKKSWKELKEVYSVIPIRDEPEIWIYAPGAGAKLWNRDLENNEISIGWDPIGNLHQYDSKESLLHAVANAYGKDNPSHSALALFQFSRQIQSGDIIISRSGSRTIVGIGIVQGPYSYDQDREVHHNIIPVVWSWTGSWSIPEGHRSFPQKTLTQVTEYPRYVGYVEELLGFKLPRVSHGEGEDETEVELGSKSEFLSLYTKSDALKDLFMGEGKLDTLLSLLKHKKNLVLQGAPGTGKTFVAKRLAYLLMGQEDKSRVAMVQFHQSYAYEDFIRGIRPDADGKFVLTDGLFYRFAKRAEADPKRPYIFIIDEINRGNLSKIFGELLMLVESDKRGSRHEISLTYGKAGHEEKFHVPENLYLIGTMNTADRSLAMVDYALRRRFAFETLNPEYGDTFKRELKNKGIANLLVEKIGTSMTSLNKFIAEKLEEGFCIGHSYFVPSTLPNDTDWEQWYSRVIQHEIKPLIDEYWIDDKKRREEALNHLKP